MELMVIAVVLILGIYALLFQFRSQIFGIQETHLPNNIFEENRREKEFMQIKRQELNERTWQPLSDKFKGLEKIIPAQAMKLKNKLIKAGQPMGMVEFFAFKALALVFVPTLAFFFLGNNFPKDNLFIVSLLIGFFIPELWLNAQIKKRQLNIRRDLPNIIDLLNLCVSGGLDFMLAVNRVVKDLKTCDLTRELSEVYHETQMGKTRREALKHFAERVDMPEVHSFVRTLIQADRMGTPMSEALGMQSEEMRMRRFQNGEAMALKAPVKLLLPLFAFILPVVLIIVGGPIMLQFMRGGLNIGF